MDPKQRNIPYYRPENFYQEEPFFQKLIRHYLPKNEFDFAEPYLKKMGELSAQTIAPLVLPSDQFRPELIQYDPTGKRIDHIEFHPSYQTIAKSAYEFGILGLGESKAFREKNIPYTPLLKFALGYLFSQAGSVLYCPICMTDGTLQLLKRYGSKELQEKWIPRITSMDYSKFSDGGMYLTEAQGGSDVGANTCQARQENGAWKIYGEKWFCSNAGSDTALVLARPENAPGGTRGLGLFLVPRYMESGESNRLHINRLKPKLGTCEMPTAEIEFLGATGYLVGELAKGFSYMTDMLNLSRVYNAIWSVGLMRRSYLEARYYAENRKAFGQAIAEYPLVAQTLSWMNQDAEKAASLVFETLKYMDRLERKEGSDADGLFLRMLTPVIKFYTAEKAIEAAHRAVEILGGNGCIEDFPVAKILRDAQILAIWEGTANILCLDLLRVLKKTSAGQVFLEGTRHQLETASLTPSQREEMTQRHDALTKSFDQVSRGDDGYGGQLACRPLAIQLADFIQDLTWMPLKAN